MNKSKAIKATKNGAVAALISGIMTLTITAIAIKFDADDKLSFFNDPSIYIDVALIFGLAFGMYKKSRVASILMFIYFIASKVLIASETQSYGGFGLGLIFLYFYGKAIQGSFVFHKLEKKENPAYKASSIWAYVIGVPVVIILILIFVFGLMSLTGVVPATRVQAGHEMSDKDFTLLVDNGIISFDTKIEYFYSQGIMSVIESGNILTHDRVMLYYINENKELEVYEIFINDITNVELEEEGSVISPSVYKVNTDDEDDWLKLFLSIEQKGDEKFINALNKKIIELK